MDHPLEDIPFDLVFLSAFLDKKMMPIRRMQSNLKNILITLILYVLFLSMVENLNMIV